MHGASIKGLQATAHLELLRVALEVLSLFRDVVNPLSTLQHIQFLPSALASREERGSL
jgi:hypothetical protein